MAGFGDMLMATLAAATQNPERDLGLSPQSEYVRSGLGAMQAQGVQPQLGNEAMPLIMQLIDALANSKPDRPKPPAPVQPRPQSPANEMQMLNTPGAASANSPENLALLQALLGG